MTTLLEPKSWTGEFFHPDHFDERFPGTLSYTPEHGTVLTYRKASGGDIPPTQILHGVLDSGDMCTLFGNFKMSDFGFAMRNGLHTYHGKSGFRAMLIGAFVREDFTFQEISFSLSGLESFLVNESRKAFIRFQPEAVLTLTLPLGNLELRTTGSFCALPHDILATIRSKDEAANESLSAAYQGVLQSHPDTIFWLKNELAFRFFLELSSPTSLEKAYRHLADVADLLALLIDAPTHPLFIEVHMEEEGHTKSLQIYPTMGLNASTVARAHRRASHSQLPITAEKINLQATLHNWFASDFRQSVLVSSIQHEVGFRTEHTAHGDLVLYASQLETISHAAGRIRDKYEYPISTYGTIELLGVLERSLGVQGASNVGEAIADLRNEIAHVGRPKKLLLKMELNQLMHVGRALHLVLVAYMLESITVPKALTAKYVNSLLPR